MAFAEEIDPGDTAWMITATALVLFMTIPGLSLSYAGMVRSKNAFPPGQLPQTSRSTRNQLRPRMFRTASSE